MPYMNDATVDRSSLAVATFDDGVDVELLTTRSS
jgi:hypothetical protein